MERIQHPTNPQVHYKVPVKQPIYYGNKAREIWINAMNEERQNGKYPPPYCKGIFIETDSYIVFDNQQGELFTENTNTLKKAIQWLRMEIETEDLYNNSNN